jgi:predicted O-methyltransferase YrrM
MPSRDLEDITGESLAAFAGPAKLLPKLVETPGFQKAQAYFTDYPERVLASPRVRAFMYQLVRARRPELMVEIGTYFAGTTEVIARAMWANGNAGKLVTIDPYGGHRVPGILSQWPPALQDAVIFLDRNSMDFYIEFGAHTPLIDIAFIDGNHSYEFAFYDLISLAKWARPGGIIILDDCDQPGVFWAAKHFLDLNPGWREVSGVFDDFDAARPFASMRSSVEDVGYLILEVPETFEITQNPISFSYSRFRQRGIGGFRIHPTANSGAGELGAGKPEQLVTSFSTVIEKTEDMQSISLDQPFLTELDTWVTTREAELAFVWYPRDGATPLSLAERPELIVTD